MRPNGWLRNLGGKHRAWFLLSVWASVGVAVIPVFLSVYGDNFFSGNFNAVSILPDQLASISTLTGLDAIGLMYVALPLVFLVVVAAAFAFEYGISRLRIDRDDWSWSSVVWAIKTWSAALVWMIPMVLLASIALLSEKLAMAVLVLILFYLMCVPFIALNANNLAQSRPVRVWGPAWPGKNAFLECTLIWLAAAFWSLSSMVYDEFGFGRNAGLSAKLLWFLADWAISYVCWIAFLWIWINRSNWRSLMAERKSVFGMKTVAVFIVQDLRVALMICLALAPMLAMSLLLVFVVPQVQNSLRYQGLELPEAIYVSIAAVNWLVEYWYLLALPLVAWFSLVSMGRLLLDLGLARGTGRMPAEQTLKLESRGL